MKRILVATDGSEGAARAVDYAARWAKRTEADLVIANVVGGYGLPDNLVRTFTRAQHAWLDELLQSLSAKTLSDARGRAKAAGAGKIELASCNGEVAQAIIEIAQERQADAIVIGKRGAGRVAGLLLGSVSQKLVSLSPLPVIVVP